MRSFRSRHSTMSRMLQLPLDRQVREATVAEWMLLRIGSGGEDEILGSRIKAGDGDLPAWLLQDFLVIETRLAAGVILRWLKRRFANTGGSYWRSVGRNRARANHFKLPAIVPKNAIRNLIVPLLFVALELKHWACRKSFVSPLIAVNSFLKLTGPCFEKGIVAQMEDFREEGCRHRDNSLFPCGVCLTQPAAAQNVAA